MSLFRQRAEEYLEIRRSLGFQLVEHGRLLMQFVDYLERAGATRLTIASAVAWARQPSAADPCWWSKRLEVARCFARHLHAIDPTCEVPPRDLLRVRHRRPVPHLYSEQEIVALMAATGTLLSPLRRATYRTLIGLLAVTGMRVGEAIGLDRHDVHWADGLLVVAETKFRRTREVVLHPSTLEALRAYASTRDRLCGQPEPPSFFVSHLGRGLVYRSVGWTFRSLVCTAGIEAAAGSRPPRLHDLRHSFIVRTLLRWYQAGADVEALLPRLSTYVGHVDPVSTYWYLQGAPELLALVAGRLEGAFEEVS